MEYAFQAVEKPGCTLGGNRVSRQLDISGSHEPEMFLSPIPNIPVYTPSADKNACVDSLRVIVPMFSVFQSFRSCAIWATPSR